MSRHSIVCGGLLSVSMGMSAAVAEPMVALDSTNSVYFFDSESAALGTGHVIGGIAPGQLLSTLDKRPVDNEVYGLAQNGALVQLYLIDFASFSATPIGGVIDTGSTIAVFAMDFNPQVDRIRLVSGSNQNLRLNPLNGTVVGTDSVVSYAPMTFPGSPRVGAVAYSNNVPSAATTIAYAIDYPTDRLMTLGKADGSKSPNGGVLHSVGALGITSNAANLGFDISAAGRARALLTPSGVPTLCAINLVSGAATSLGAFPAGSNVQDIAFLSGNLGYDLLFANGFELGEP